jgi:Zn-dependent protease with chaperone function
VDFFARQDSARRRTTLLVVYFVIAVALIVAALNLVVALALGYTPTKTQRQRTSQYRQLEADAPRTSAIVWRSDVIAWTTGLTLLVISCGTLYRIFSLRGGGRSVATLAGGRELDPGSTEPDHRRLLNIIEEMSIASGVPMPAVFILVDEPGLNAFAAGFSPSDAAIAVTQGCLDKLTRDELQGVIAHEFSHILNGDMRLNVRLIGVLFGILMLAMIGRGLLQSLRFANTGGGSRKGKGAGGAIALIVAVGLALLLIGYIGYFFGRLIQAAVSRQRECLADAAAVQFTRNPAGISGALKKIGAYSLGSGIVTEQATQLRHFFFAQAFTGGFSPLATHPPLQERIRALDPQWDGQFPAITLASIAGWEDNPAVPQRAFAPPPLPPAAIPTAVLLASIGAPTSAHLDRARQLLAALPPRLAAAARSPAEALSVVFALLLASDPASRNRQLDTIRVRHGQPFADAFTSFAPAAYGLAAELRLPLLDIALPALRRLPPSEISGSLETVRLLIEADGEVTLFEFMVEKALDRHVAAPARGERQGVVNFYSFGALADEIALLLSALSRVGSDSPEETSRAFAAAGARIPPLAGKLALRPADACTLAAIGGALDKLVQASPAIRKVLILAGTEAIAADGTIEPDEADLLRAVADALDCPIPPLLSAPGEG